MTEFQCPSDCKDDVSGVQHAMRWSFMTAYHYYINSKGDQSYIDSLL